MPDCYNQLLQTNNQAPRKFADRVSMTQILDVVTEALRVAKSNGRNRVEIAPNETKQFISELAESSFGTNG